MDSSQCCRSSFTCCQSTRIRGYLLFSQYSLNSWSIYIAFWNVPLIPLRISYNLLYSFVSILPYMNVIIFTFVDSTSLSTNLFMSVLIQSINTIYALSLYLYEICLSYSLLLKKYRSLCVLTHLVNLSAKSHVTNMISNRMWHQPH